MPKGLAYRTSQITGVQEMLTYRHFYVHCSFNSISKVFLPGDSANFSTSTRNYAIHVLKAFSLNSDKNVRLAYLWIGSNREEGNGR